MQTLLAGDIEGLAAAEVSTVGEGGGVNLLDFLFGKRAESLVIGLPEVTPQHKHSDRDLSLAALQNLSLPSFNATFPQGEEALNAGQLWVDEKLRWLDTIEDPRVRQAYAGWIQWVQRGINENREENRTHLRRRAYETWKSEGSAESAKAFALSLKLPKP